MNIFEQEKVNEKAYVFYVYKNKINPVAAKRLARQFEVSNPSIIWKVKREEIQPLLKYKALTLPQIKYYWGKIVEDTRPYVGKYINKKLKFIYMTDRGLTFKDIEYDLIYYGLKAISKKYPCIENYKHACNIYCRSVHNRGVNLIKMHTTQSRNRLEQNPDGTFTFKIVPYEYNEESEDMREDLLLLEQITQNLSSKKARFLQLMTGEYDEDFTRWLRQRCQINDTNTSYHGKAYKKYIRMVAEYLQVDYEKCASFLEELARATGRDFSLS